MKNKCLYFSAFALILVSALVGYQVVHARLSPQTGDQIVRDTQSQDDVAVHLQMANLSAATSSVLVHKADNINFRHISSNGVLRVSRIRVSIDATTLATTTIKFGVMASTSASGATSDISYFYQVNYLGADKKYQDFEFNPSPAMEKLGVSSATTTGFITNDTLLATTNFATTTALTSPRGAFTVNPAVGDLVMSVYSIVGNATVTVDVIYNVE